MNRVIIRAALFKIRNVDPIEDVTFGQGSFGKRCHFCGADDWNGELVHDLLCLWTLAQ